MLISSLRALVVEMDETTQPAQSQTVLSAQSPVSPVSILQNSPFYSPVRTAPTFSSPFMEQIIGNVCSDDQADIDEDFAHDINDSDEGIESEDGEDIDGEAFKQLIR